MTRLEKMHGATLCCCLLAVLSVRGCGASCGERSGVLRGAEDVCWTRSVEVAERVQHGARTVLNFAKKTLGIGNEDQIQPQKCTYYYCIFQELKLLKPTGYLDQEKLARFIKNNVIYVHGEILLDRAKMCFNAYENSTESVGYFDSDTIDDETTTSTIHIIPNIAQTECEVAMEMMKCLSKAEHECITFQYP